MRSRGLIVALILWSAGCSEDAPSPDALAPSESLPCFAEAGPEVFRVIVETDSGPSAPVGVRDGVVNAFVAALQDGEPGAAEPLAKRAAVEATIPVAAAYALHRAMIPQLETRLLDARRRLDAGAALGELAGELSDDPKTRTGQGELPPVSRGQRLEELGLQRAIWSAPIGKVIGPVFSVQGAHLLEVQSERAGAARSRDQRRVRHILFAFDGPRVRDGTYVTTVLAGLLARVRVEVLDPSYKKNLVPEVYWRAR